MRKVIVFFLLLALAAVSPPALDGKEPHRDLGNLTAHVPIRIDSDRMLRETALKEGWPGNGSSSNPFIISNLSVEGAGYGFCIYMGNTTEHFVISSCHLFNATGNWNFLYENTGLYLYNVSAGVVRDCWLDNSTTGAQIIESTNASILSSTLRDHFSWGIHIVSCSGITLGELEITHSWEAISLGSASRNNHLRNNIITDSNMRGVYLQNLCDGNIIEGNTVSTSPGYGISLDHANDNRLRSNMVRWCGYGIRLSNMEGRGQCRRNVISNNTIRENTIGYAADGSDSNIFEYNNVSLSEGDGVRMESGSMNETVRSNKIYANGGFGIVADGEAGRFYWNDLRFNNGSTEMFNLSHVQAADNGLYNNWSREGEGNHWADWTSPDGNSDGIVDFPYYLQGGSQNRDPYPLVNPPLPPLTPPSRPLNLTGVIGRYFIHLDWSYPLAHRSLAGFRIYRNTTGGDMGILTDIGPGVHDFNDTPLAPGTTYGYAVSAYNDAGESDLSVPFMGAVPERFGRPLINIIEPSNGSFLPPGNITVNWSVDLQGGILDHFEVSLNGGSWINVGSESSIELTDAEPGPNILMVRCFNSEGGMGESEIEFFIDSSSPVVSFIYPTPGSMVNSSAIMFKWHVEENGSGVLLSRIRLDGGNWTEAANSTEEATFFDIPEGPHVVEVEAIDLVGNRGNISIGFEVDTSPPPILNVWPTGDDVPRNTTIWFEFGEEVKPESIEVHLRPSIDFNLTMPSPTLVEIAPVDPLEPGVTYTITVYASDRAGNRMGPYTWDFTVPDYYLMASVSGYVVDSYGGYIQGVNVTVGNITVFTNAFGIFDLDIDPGNYTIIVTKEGYDPYSSNITLLPRQDLDMGKLVLRGGTPPVGSEGGGGFPLWPVIIIFLLGGGLAMGSIALRNRSQTNDANIEE